MMTERYVAAGGIVFHGDRVLLLHRPGRDEIRLPKGHVESGERVEDAALRETREESGLADPELVAPLSPQVHSFLQDGGLVQRHEHFYVMRIDDDQRVERPEADRAQFEPRWTALDVAQSRLTYESERNAYRKALAYWRAQA